MEWVSALFLDPQAWKVCWSCTPRRWPLSADFNFSVSLILFKWRCETKSTFIVIIAENSLDSTTLDYLQHFVIEAIVDYNFFIIYSFSHHLCCVCVNFIREWCGLQFNVDSKGRIFEKLFMGILFTLKVFARNLLRGSHRRHISFRCRLQFPLSGLRPSFSHNSCCVC